MGETPAKDIVTAPAVPSTARRAGFLRRLAPRRVVRDESGSAAVEFGIIALPFFALIFAILETALAFNRGMYDIAIEEDDDARLEARLGAFYDEAAATLTDAEREGLQLNPDQRAALLQQLTSPWVRAFLAKRPPQFRDR